MVRRSPRFKSELAKAKALEEWKEAQAARENEEGMEEEEDIDESNKKEIQEICQDLGNFQIQTSEQAQREFKVGLQAAREQFTAHVIGSTKNKDDADPKIVNWLKDLVNLMSDCLPKTPKDDISEHVFKPGHRSLVFIKDGTPIGGICFRMFEERGFSEIIFCAVRQDLQGQGYGAYLMHIVKDYHMDQKYYNLLTCADVGALEYFRKEGFTQNVKVPLDRYYGCLKESRRSVLLHCELRAEVTYTIPVSVILRQEKRSEELMKLEKQKEDKLKELNQLKGGRVKKRGGARKKTIPAPDVAAAVCSRRGLILPREDPRPDQTPVFTLILNQVKDHRMASTFMKPVTGVDGYLDVIKYPMDLKMITRRLRKGSYTSARLFMRDMYRMFNNCRQFNGRETDFYKAADALELYFTGLMMDLD